MKNWKLLVPVLAAFIFTACDSASDNPVEENGKVAEVSARNYYPGGIGSKFTFQSDTVNTETGARGTASTRVAEIKGFEVLEDTIITQATSVDFTNVGVNNVEIQMRRTNFGLYVQIDSTGIIDGLEIADSLDLADINLKLDREFIAVSYPFFEGKFWFAFMLQASIGDLPFFPVLTMKANYLGEEEIFVQADMENRIADKIKYTTEIVLPDASGTGVSNQQFETYAWYVKNIGLVKTEGSGIIQSVLSGVINFSTLDSTTKMIDELISYEIK